MKIVSMSDIAASIESEEYGTRAYMHNEQGHEQLRMEAPGLADDIIASWAGVPMVELDLVESV